MTSETSEVLTDLSEWASLEGDLAAILSDVLSSILGEEVLPAYEPPPRGEQAVTRLAIHDLIGDAYVEIEVLVPMALAKVIAARMLGVGQPLDDDIVDAIAELGNIAGGNVKSVLFEHSRLSLPMPRFELSAGETDRHPEGVVARAAVNGHVAELAVFPVAAALGLEWPPHPDPDENDDTSESLESAE